MQEYFIGPAGTVKTFTYNYLIAELRGRRIQVATAAWTGIAATLLMQGSTVHSLFRLPVPILETSSCNVTPVSKHADMLRQNNLFLFDEGESEGYYKTVVTHIVISRQDSNSQIIFLASGKLQLDGTEYFPNIFLIFYFSLTKKYFLIKVASFSEIGSPNFSSDSSD